jgi:hypothetical protein
MSTKQKKARKRKRRYWIGRNYTRIDGIRCRIVNSDGSYNLHIIKMACGHEVAWPQADRLSIKAIDCLGCIAFT